MEKRKKERLEKQGWKVSSAQQFLKLSSDEAAYLEMKIALAKTLVERRKARQLSQAEVAKLIESSQSRVAKMEAGDSSVSIDLLVRSLLALGTPKKTLTRVLAHS